MQRSRGLLFLGVGHYNCRASAVGTSYTLGVRSIMLGERHLETLSAARSRRAVRGIVVILFLSMVSQVVPDMWGRCLDLVGCSVSDTSATPPNDVPP